MIRNIVFDMGNTLLDIDEQPMLDAFCSTEEEKEMIRRELFRGPEWVMGDLGTIRDDDRFELIRDRVPEKHWPLLERCCAEWYIPMMAPLPGAAEFCAYVKEKGYRRYILSNASDAFYRYFPRFLPLESFDGVLVSADVHLLKPDRRIYELLLERFGLKGEECLFLDDMPQNVEGARKAGLNAFLFTGDYEQVKRECGL